MNKLEFAKKEHFSFQDLNDLVTLLRSPEGCPWDREQTHESIRNNFVEEAYEVCEGIDRKDDRLLCEELGDVLLQVVFHTSIACDEGRFKTEDVIDGICRKMIRRHPHIFQAQPIDKDRIQENWDEIKKREKGEKTLADTLSRVSTALPALKRAEKYIEKGAVPAKVDVDEKLLKKGEALYRIVADCMASDLDAEQALNAYLNQTLKNCTNFEKED